MKRKSLLLSSFFVLLFFSACNNFVHDLLPNSENEILSFRVYDQNGNDVTESSHIDGDNIILKVHAYSDISALVPVVVSSEKSSVIPITVNYIHKAAPSVDLLNFAVTMQESRQNGNLASWALDFAQKTPDFHVPELTETIDFRTTVPIAVIAGDGNTRVYQVTVDYAPAVNENGEVLESQSEKEILSFVVDGQEGESQIDETGVTFVMPEDCDIRNLIPAVTVSEGAGVLPFTQDYLLKYVGFEDLLSLLSGYSSASNPEKFLEQWLRKNNITIKGELDTPIDFSSTVYFLVRAADGSVKMHPVSCLVNREKPSLLYLVFTKLENESLVRDCEADFSYSTSVGVDIVYPAEYITDSTGKEDAYHLVPSVSIDGEKAEFSMDDGATWQDLVSSETVIPFTAIKKDCKIRVWKGTKSADYNLSLSYTEDPDTIRSITDFRFPKSKNPAIKATALATIVDDGDVGTITISVVYNAGDEAAVETLTSTFVSTGTVYNASDSEITSGCGFYGYGYDPEHPEIRKTTLTCVSRNGMYRRVYSVTIKFVEVQPAVAAMRTFTFPALLNPSLAGDAVGIINDSNQTILVNAVYRTAEKPSRLVAEFTSTGNVDADGIPQSSGYSGSDFRYARNYTVTASDDPGVKKTYRVQVSFRYDTSMACSLDSMVFRAADNPTLSKDVEVSISQSGLKGTAFLPYGTDSWNTALIPTFEAQGKVSVNGVPQTSGVDSWNFSDDVVYTVESADRSVRKDYTIHVTETGSIIYVDCRAQGRGDGSSWENAFTTVTAAGEALDMLPDGSSVEVWIADTDGREYYIEDPNDTYDGKGHDCLRLNNDKPGSTIAIRGGFSGTESTPEERNVESLKNRVFQGYGPLTIIEADLKSLVLDGLTYIDLSDSHIEDLTVKNSKPRHSSIYVCRMHANADSVHIENSDVDFGFNDYYTLRTSNITAENSVVGGHFTVKNGGEAVFKECRTFSNPEEKRRGDSLDVKFDGNGKCSFKDCELYEMRYDGGDGELDFKNCKVGVYKDDTDVLDENHFNYEGLYVPYSNTNVGNVKIKIEDSEVSFTSRYDNSFPHTLEASSSVLYHYANLGEGRNLDINITDCKLISPLSIRSDGNLTIRNSEVYGSLGRDEDRLSGGPINVSSMVLDGCSFYTIGWDKDLKPFSRPGAPVSSNAITASVTNCKNLTYLNLPCTQSASVKNNTFLNTEGETCVNIRAPSSLTFENNEFEKWGIVELSTEGHLDFKDFTLKQQDAKMRFGLEMGSGSYDLQDWNCEYQYVKTGAGTNLTATDCVIYETLQAKENCTFELSGCKLGVKNQTETSEYMKVESLKVGSGSTVTAENCTMDGNVSGSGNLSFSGCTIKGNISGRNISTHNATGIEGKVEGSQDVSLDGGQVTSSVTAHGNLTLSGSVIVGGDVIGHSNATFNSGTQIKGYCFMLVNVNNTKLTASNTTILGGLMSTGTVQMTGCNLCSGLGSAYISTNGSGWATFTNCTLHGSIYGDGTTATGCVIYGSVNDNSPSSVFRACNLTGENACVNSVFCGTMTGCEFNGKFTTDRIQGSTGTFDGCWFNPAEGSSLTGINVRCGATIRNMTFYRHGDTAIDVRNGDSSRTTTIENCKFLANSSQGFGGGIGIIIGNALVKNCIFCENHASSGGGISYSVTEARSCTIQDCLFVNNDAAQGSGHDGAAGGPKGSSVNFVNSKAAGTIFNILWMFSKYNGKRDIDTNMPSLVSDTRHAEDFL